MKRTLEPKRQPATHIMINKYAFYMIGLVLLFFAFLLIIQTMSIYNYLGGI